MPSRENQGFFTKPKIIAGLAIKDFEGLLTEQQARELIDVHTQYLEALRNAGINFPKTQMHCEKTVQGYKIRIIQEAFQESELVKNIVESASREQALSVVAQVLKNAEKAINYNVKTNGTFGFHLSLGNFALRNSVLYFFDTFPPMISKRQTAQIIRKHSPWPKSKIARTALSPLAFLATSEYYNPAKMINGIVVSAARLRPELKKELVELAVITGVKVLPKKVERIRKRVVASVERKGYRKAVDFAKRFVRRAK